MEARAVSRFVRYSPRKVGLVLDLVRNKSVPEAFQILRFVPKLVTGFIGKTLKSAAANAGRMKKPGELFIKTCYVNQGPSIKRWRARAYGRAAPYRHRTCHLTIVVSDQRGV
ncbi:MAG: 50S ribosomal protein L22 [Elusimicrobia bacterium CG1_02_37_114]|nr:MAG: 50S ribosomal protein L22 [Elusimicrobia bacterium CG1_02_37_114]PIV52562.1 MAG: 50S ribosomal protein L22 [Elusimicrobia bacterium CG02_land_8_20_14_3_00_37_13]PIZ13291.1 MAG: 50S ribosomal protein L22 [Elusimicrobia bacterium CG_4_10_14_0_8_um_filter_37_32]